MLPRPSRNAETAWILLHRKGRPLNGRENAAEGVLPESGSILQDGHVAGLGCKVCFETQSENKCADQKQRLS